MCPSLIEIGSKTAEKNSAQTTNRQTNRQTDRDRHYENSGHLAVNQQYTKLKFESVKASSNDIININRFANFGL